MGEVYVDDDQSAYSGRRRPEYARLLDDIKAGAVAALVVWHVDRLHRQPKELETFIEVCDAAGLANLATVTGDVDLSTHDGRFMARILGAVARKESDDKSRRLRRKHEELAAEGKNGGGGYRPFGFEADRVTIRESEAVIIGEITARVLGGDSLSSICRDLDERGVKTSRDRGWTLASLRRMIMSPRISGQREHRGEIVGPAQWEAIISPATTARLRAVLGDPRRRTSRSPRRYLLAGMLRCTRCGATLLARPKAGGRRNYACLKGPGRSGCGGLSVTADPIEALVVAGVLHRLDSPELARALANGPDDSEGESLSDELAADQAQLAELAGAYGTKTITYGEWMAAREPIEARLDATKRRLSTLNRSTVLDPYLGDVDALRTAWDGLPLPRQQAIVKTLIDHIDVAPAPRPANVFEPDRVTPIWRL